MNDERLMVNMDPRRRREVVRLPFDGGCVNCAPRINNILRLIFSKSGRKAFHCSALLFYRVVKMGQREIVHYTRLCLLSQTNVLDQTHAKRNSAQKINWLFSVISMIIAFAALTKLQTMHHVISQSLRKFSIGFLHQSSKFSGRDK